MIYKISKNLNNINFLSLNFSGYFLTCKNDFFKGMSNKILMILNNIDYLDFDDLELKFNRKRKAEEPIDMNNIFKKNN